MTVINGEELATMLKYVRLWLVIWIVCWLAVSFLAASWLDPIAWLLDFESLSLEHRLWMLIFCIILPITQYPLYHSKWMHGIWLIKREGERGTNE